MKNAILTFAAALLFTFVCATTVGDGVPLMYSPTPYPNTIYNGTQYNSTTIDGVTYNASNEWPCLTEKQYESIIPPCSLTCISESLAKDDCDVDDFVCHCTATASAKIDTNVVPCLTSGPDALCNGTEIGELANFVHGALCPYFIAVGYEAYDNCGATWVSTSSSSFTPELTCNSSVTQTWATWAGSATATATTTSGYWSGTSANGTSVTKTWQTWAGSATATATGGYASANGTSVTAAQFTGAAPVNKVAGAMVAGGAAAAAFFL